ncbi:gluconokinase [Leifsonia sp. NPDC058230]|uniref:gluconokinase n=1 Tax=Leifsonia sp. NPDC058230 TaxID=3346391 RepID=UPI0036D88F12
MSPSGADAAHPVPGPGVPLVAPLVVVMGVSGSGKSTVGVLLAERLGVPFVDGDDLHPDANVAKMASGIPLDDDDRWPWLANVGRTLAAAAGSGMVVACSALKREYRAAILAEAPDALFVELDGGRDLVQQRIGSRRDHFMPAALLDSQLATLQPLASDEPGVRVPIDGTPAEIAAAAATSLAERVA